MNSFEALSINKRLPGIVERCNWRSHGSGKIDRRRRYTLSVIREAFFALLAEVGFAKMTVADICRRADYQPRLRSICITRISLRCLMCLSMRLWRRHLRSRGRSRGPFASGHRQTMTIICSTRMTTRTPGWHSAASSAAPSRCSLDHGGDWAFARGRYLLFVHNVQGNLAVNRLLGWRRGPSLPTLRSCSAPIPKGACGRCLPAMILVVHLDHGFISSKQCSYELRIKRHSVPRVLDFPAET